MGLRVPVQRSEDIAVNEKEIPERHERLKELLRELKVMNAWDKTCTCIDEPSFIETSASVARRQRVLEIFTEFNELTGRVV